jgi:NADP-dependent 3-hydroxy acid dehydrogenase YdfG
VMEKLNDQVHIVTGAGSGIGRVTAIALAREGAKVALLGRTLSKLESVAHEITGAGGSALALATDVGFEDQVQKAFRTIVDTFGPVDLLLNNAGDEAFGKVSELTEEKWEERERVNLKALFLTSKAVLTIGGMLKRNHGTIINTASSNVRASAGGWAAHIAFKHASLGFTESLRKEVAENNIRVTLLCPGQVGTEWALSPRVRNESARIHPKPRYLLPEDIAEITVFLARLPDRVNVGEILVFHTGRVQ